MNRHEIHDPDGNVIRRGTAIINRGTKFLVDSINGRGRNLLLVADHFDPQTGVKIRLICGRNRLRYLHVLGYERPPLNYP